VAETYRFFDAQGLAGAWTLGTVLTGRYELVGRWSLPGGFGDEVIDGNRHLVGDGWQQQVGTSGEIEPMSGISFMAGTPPCSGFSLLNRSRGENARGASSNINDCMKELIAAAGRFRGADGGHGPEVVAFESVQGAFKEGRDLMLWLRDDLSERTGEAYSITHVLMSGSSVGAAQMRHRYYPIFHRVPFGLTPPAPKHVITYDDAIGDLCELAMTWDAQSYVRPVLNEWAARKRRVDGLVTDHVAVDSGRLVRYINEALEDTPHGWLPGESVKDLVKRTGVVPKTIWETRYVEEDESGNPYLVGWGWPKRIRADRPGYVLTGGSVSQFVHWEEPRLLTVRECSRLMGYPDAWRWDMARNQKQAGSWIGKCCPVDSGRWISDHVAFSLDDPDDARALANDFTEKLDERERLYDCTLDYRKWPEEVSGWTAKPRELTSST